MTVLLPFFVSVATPLIAPPVIVYALVELLNVTEPGDRLAPRTSTLKAAAVSSKVTLSPGKNLSGEPALVQFCVASSQKVGLAALPFQRSEAAPVLLTSSCSPSPLSERVPRLA